MVNWGSPLTASDCSLGANCWVDPTPSEIARRGGSNSEEFLFEVSVICKLNTT